MNAMTSLEEMVVSAQKLEATDLLAQVDYTLLVAG